MITKRVVFWSSVDAAMFMRALVASLCARGILAEHRFTVSNADYRKRSTLWSRILLRVRMYIEYPIRLALACLLDRKPRIFVVTTNTFYAPLIANIFSRHNQPVVHLVWDLFPDALVESAICPRNSVAATCMKAVVQRTFQMSAANVFLGRQLLAYAESQFREITKPCIIAVGADANIFRDSSPRLVELCQPVDILYCGNLGTMHDTSTLISAVQALKPEAELWRGFTLSFHSSGPLYADFKSKMAHATSVLGERIRLDNALSDEAWTIRMKKAHVALVTMNPGAERVVMPSKTYSALAAGQAILAICPCESDLARLILKEDCGWVVPPGRPDDLVRVLDEICSQRALLHRKRENAYRVGQSKYSDATVAQEWANLLNAL